MRLSTTTLTGFDYWTAIEMCAKAGFDCIDLNLIENAYAEEFSDENYPETCKKLLEKIKALGLVFNQAHAPFPSLKWGDDVYNQKVHSGIVRAIRIAGLLGAEQVVVHPFTIPDKEKQLEANLAFFNSLAPICREAGTKVAIENMFSRHPYENKIIPGVCNYPEDMIEIYEALDPECFTLCLDTGHCALLKRNPADYPRALTGKRLHALHVQDNVGKDDIHTIPYQGNIDWTAFMQSLADAGYTGDLTFEVGGKLFKPYKDKPDMQQAYFSFLAATGRHLIGIFDARRAEIEGK